MNTNNLKKSEKSRGIVAFATNTDTTDYVSIATETLKLASHQLQLPHTLITGGSSDNFNSRYDIDTGKYVSWQNFNRYQAYELSPYNETLVIDADYLILDNNLGKLFDIDFDYLLQRNSYALTQHWPNAMGTNSLPHVWATVFAFRKTDKSRNFFNLVKRIQENYGYYHMLFNIRERNYRNDYAFAMADIILNGYCINPISIPGNMLTVDQVINSIEIKKNSLVIRDDNKAYIVPKTNLHIMSKAYLQSKNFYRLIEEIINESA